MYRPDLSLTKQQPIPRYKHVHQTNSYRRRFCLYFKTCTLSFDSEEDSVHLINEDHSFKYFDHLLGIVNMVFDKQLSVEVNQSVGRDFAERTLRRECVGINQFSVGLSKCGGHSPHYFFSEVVKHVTLNNYESTLDQNINSRCTTVSKTLTKNNTINKVG